MEFLLFNIYLLIIAIVYRVLFDKKGKVNWNRWLLLMPPVFLYLITFMNSSLTPESGLFEIELDLVNIT